MNPNEFHQMYKYLVRPSRAKIVESAKKELGIPKNAKINNGSEILDWINFNQKLYGNNKMPLTPEERKTGEKIERIIAGGNNVANAEQLKEKKEAKWKYTSRMDEIEEEEKIDPKEFEDIKKSLPVSEMVKKEETPKKKIIKKTLIVEKPKPVKPPVISLLELEDWLNEVDPNTWTEEESKKEVLLQVPRRSLRGLASILNLHKRST